MLNSLDRLLEGMAAGLRGDVLPALEDDYARAQALACAELIENLAGQVQWRVDRQLAEIRRIRDLAESVGTLPEGEPALQPVRLALAEAVPEGTEPERLRVAHERHLAALGALVEWSGRSGARRLALAAGAVARELQEEESARFAQARELVLREEKG